MAYLFVRDILLILAILAYFWEHICVPVKADGGVPSVTDQECAKWNESVSNGIVGEFTPDGNITGVCGFANMANCVLAVVANPNDTYYNGTEMFIPDHMLNTCLNNTTLVFQLTPQNEHLGKYLVNLYKNGSEYYITEGYIYLPMERPTQPQPTTGNMSGCNGIGWSNVIIVLAGLAMLINNIIE